jgi:hypothetical protein
MILLPKLPFVPVLILAIFELYAFLKGEGRG